MQVKQTSGKAFERRVVFGKEKNLIALPDLVEVQRNSYQWFFQADREPDMRASQGCRSFSMRFSLSRATTVPSLWNL